MISLDPRKKIFLFEDVSLQKKQDEVAANESLGLEGKRVSKKKKDSKIDSVEESIIESDNSIADSEDKTKRNLPIRDKS